MRDKIDAYLLRGRLAWTARSYRMSGDYDAAARYEEWLADINAPVWVGFSFTRGFRTPAAEADLLRLNQQ